MDIAKASDLSRWSSLRYKIRRQGLNRFYNSWIDRFYAGKGTLLDIGCGDGNFISYMKDLGWNAFGVEADKDVIKNISEDLKARIKLVNANLDEANFETESINVASLWNVFEHIPDSDVLLDAVKRILTKNGLLVLQVPNIESLEARIFKMNWVHLDPPRHAHHFSINALSEILIKKNFKIKAITHFSPVDKSYRGSFEIFVRSKSPLEINSYFFHNILYKVILDMIFIPLNIIGSILKKGTFITIACVNEK